ncbi:DMT family transporter [Candidatus Zixiibacteriota bacterium]
MTMPDGMSKSLKRIALLPAASMVLAWVPIFIRLAAEGDVPALIIAFDRLMIAAVALTLYVVFFRRQTLAGFRGRALIAAICAGLLFGFHVYTYVLAVKYTTVANSMLLLATIPMFAAVLGHFFLKEKPHPLSYAGILLAMAGTALVVWGDLRWDPEHLKGDLFGLISAVLGAGYFLMRRIVPKKDLREFVPYILIVYVVSMIVLLLTVLVSGQAGRIFGHPPITWLWFFILGTFGTVLGHSLFNKALDYFKAHVAGSWILTEPIISAMLAWIILAEAFNRHVLWGVVPIYVGVVWILWLERER